MVDFFAVFLRNLQTIGLADILDILIVTLLVFSVIKFVRETRAVNLIKGLVLCGYHNDRLSGQQHVLLGGVVVHSGTGSTRKQQQGIRMRCHLRSLRFLC